MSSIVANGVRALAGRAALVTGSTSGIGLGVARVLASQGASVMLNGFGDAAEIKAIQTSIQDEFEVPVGFHGADLSSESEIQDLMDATHSTLGGLDVLVNNAGIQHVCSTHDFPVDQWHRVCMAAAVVGGGIAACLRADSALGPRVGRSSP